ncbi:MAG: hypothetical protein IJN91_04925 [Alphaproteobacteria bacterium]|nr:hypothetical protein [Alphaproteobacteria bacterium]
MIKTKFQTNTTSFTIAHYLLLFFVMIFCISIIAWVMISRNNSAPTNNISGNILHIHSSAPCVQRTIKTVKQMWEYDPKSVPEKYWEIAMSYMNQKIQDRTYGICQDVAYICPRGAILYDCNPCAVPMARDYAQNIHIADMIVANCGTKE